ncbi:ubiquitin-60S ribosomal protein L40 [Galendromus occidentalis]|uniref:Ubiquitin-ribosomal protein eL40 fusion protein n=1 Tax=Galendromus occidentalis TaxID=34638 RepID=A0AAJ6QYX2_9ACAR|nr:ubiquitin-60S ribosomal protein L40 [Galendromus occidentalis]XP_018497000.1 ubiquitin-60S ribosomal protein L40 [Galendromus occidentalis]
MQVFVQSIDGQTIPCEVEEGSSFGDLMHQLEDVTKVPFEHMRLSWGIHCYNEESVFTPLLNEKTLVLNARLPGGVIEPSLLILASKYNCEKMICRKCYARLHPKAHNCRKRKCGHCNNLRPKKKLK